MVWGGLRPEPDVRRSTATLCIAFAFSSVRKQMKPQPFASPFHLFTFCSDNNSHFFTDGNCLYQALTENYPSLSPTSAFLLSFASWCCHSSSMVSRPMQCGSKPVVVVFLRLFEIVFDRGQPGSRNGRTRRTGQKVDILTIDARDNQRGGPQKNEENQGQLFETIPQKLQHISSSKFSFLVFFCLIPCECLRLRPWAISHGSGDGFSNISLLSPVYGPNTIQYCAILYTMQVNLMILQNVPSPYRHYFSL